MKIIDLEQGTPPWIEWRSQGLGSSDIATIMNVNPYMTPYQLWEEKCGVKNAFEGNHFTQHGVLNEPNARAFLEKTTQLKLKSICAESDVNPIYKISLDAYCTSNRHLYEIKCPYTSEKIFSLRDTMEIPEMWRLQILWQAAITGAKKAYLAVWDFNLAECFCIECKRDPEMEARLFEEADKFWGYVKSFTPPPLQKKDYVEVEDEELHSYLLEYKHQNDLEKTATSKKKELKARIVEFGDDGSFKSYGYTITRSAPRQSYDVEKMRADGIDVDKYLKPSSIGFYTIRVPRE